MSEGVEIRMAAAGDLPAVASLWARLCAMEGRSDLPHVPGAGAGEAWLASFRAHLGRFAFLWVVVRGGAVGGYVLTRLRPRPPYLGGATVGVLDSMYVDPAFRSGGASARLVEAASRHLAEQGACTVELNVYASNADAIAFWRRLGFVAVEHVYARGVDALPPGAPPPR